MSTTLLHDLLSEALSLYPFNSPHAELIRHNENVTYKVMDIADKKQYVMRIHHPIEGFSLGIFGVTEHSDVYLQSELDILVALKNSTDIPIQTPVKNKNGDMVTILSDGTSVTVLKWIDGNVLEKAEITTEVLHGIGEMTAKMHKHFMENGDNYSFKRYSYDQSILLIITDRIMTATEKGYITTEQLELILSSVHEIGRRMDELDTLPNSKGIVHSDLSKANMILNMNKITPIDFCLCGYSHYYMDIGSLFGHFSDDKDRKAIIYGYQSVLNCEINLWYIEPYFTLQVILFIACQYERANEWDWFSGAMQRWCKDIFEPFKNRIAFLQI